jgi:hypothetical protein
MGAFETAAAKESKAKSTLPADVPDAKQAATTEPNGAIYKADNGQRFRLRHARTIPAQFVAVVARKPKAAATSGAATSGKK